MLAKAVIFVFATLFIVKCALCASLEEAEPKEVVPHHRVAKSLSEGVPLVRRPAEEEEEARQQLNRQRRSPKKHKHVHYHHGYGHGHVHVYKHKHKG